MICEEQGFDRDHDTHAGGCSGLWRRECVGLVGGGAPDDAAAPADKLAETRALANPLPDSVEIVEKGKTRYNGKGTCFNCHGKDGSGNGCGR